MTMSSPADLLQQASDAVGQQLEQAGAEVGQAAVQAAQQALPGLAGQAQQLLQQAAQQTGQALQPTVQQLGQTAGQSFGQGARAGALGGEGMDWLPYALAGGGALLLGGIALMAMRGSKHGELDAWFQYPGGHTPKEFTRFFLDDPEKRWIIRRPGGHFVGPTGDTPYRDHAQHFSYAAAKTLASGFDGTVERYAGRS